MFLPVSGRRLDVPLIPKIVPIRDAISWASDAPSCCRWRLYGTQRHLTLSERSREFASANLTAISHCPIQKTLVGSVQASGIHTLNTIEIQATAEEIAFERLLTADEAIRLIPIHRNTLLLWARLGKVPCIRLGRRVFFRASDLNRCLEAPCYAGHAVLTAPTERKAV